ncbi:MAG: TraB/GumN family protein, partial [Nitrospirota bacterium]|nr:TraB/GumN family protein [Nitrospirota bacterium]
MFEKYKKRVLIISVFAFFALVLSGPAAAQAGRAGQGRHFLWSVETGKNTLYLVGSIHVLKKESYPLPKQVVDIYNCCRKAVFEADLDGMNDPESQSGLMKLGMYPQGQTLSRNISAQTYQM